MKHILLVAFFAVYLVSASAEECHVVKSGDNLVKFISDAPIEDFEGVTSKIDGYIYWDGTDLVTSSELYFEVDLNSLDTGIGLRNRHMRENYLETEKYPTTHFKGKLVKSQKVSENEFKVQAQGTMFIHGIEKTKTIDGTITKDGQLFKIISKFEVKLSDYGIKIPSIMFYKIDEEMKLELDFTVKIHKE